MNPLTHRRTMSITLFAATLIGVATNAWAQTAPAAVPSGPLVLIAQFAPFLLVFAIMYFLMIRPQQQRQKPSSEDAQASLKKGDRVLTRAGSTAPSSASTRTRSCCAWPTTSSSSSRALDDRRQVRRREEVTRACRSSRCASTATRCCARRRRRWPRSPTGSAPFVLDLFETMMAEDGVGLAAHQVGVAQRVLVVDVPIEERQARRPDAREPGDHLRRTAASWARRAASRSRASTTRSSARTRSRSRRSTRPASRSSCRPRATSRARSSTRSTTSNGVLFVDRLRDVAEAAAPEGPEGARAGRAARKGSGHDGPALLTMRIVFMGTPDFAVPALEAVARPLRGAARGHAAGPAEGPRARAHGAAGRGGARSRWAFRASRSCRPNTPNALAALAAVKADLFVVVAYGAILSKDLLAVPRLGCINLHASLLPEYRGASPIQRGAAGRPSRDGRDARCGWTRGSTPAT